MQKIIGFCIFFLSFSSFSASLEYQGQARFELYSQQLLFKDSYGLYYFSLDPTVHILDGLSLKMRWEVREGKESRLSSLSPYYYRQSGSLFYYSGSNFKADLPIVSVPFVYLDFQTETLQIRVGRAPYHFGMGLSYLATKSPFLNWISSHYQVSFKSLVYGITIHPQIFFDKNMAFLLSEFSYIQDTWVLKALLQYDFTNWIDEDFEEEKKRSLVEVYGMWENKRHKIKASMSYHFKEEASGLFALETRSQIPLKAFSVFAEFKLGGAYGLSQFHPGFTPALLLWNKQIVKKDPPSLQVSESRLKDTFYFIPKLHLSFLEDQFHILPQVVFALKNQKDLVYELDLETLYSWNESLFFSIKAGLLFEDKDLEAGVLAQAAVSF